MRAAAVFFFARVLNPHGGADIYIYIGAMARIYIYVYIYRQKQKQTTPKNLSRQKAKKK